MRLVVIVLAVAGCGRVGFDARGDAATQLDGSVLPTTCATYVPPASCMLTTDVTQIRAGIYDVCALRTTGEIDCFGRNNEGELGFCTGDQVLQPTAAYNFGPNVQLVMGEQHTCARLPDGQLWCWGSNIEGEGGIGIGGASDPAPHRVAGTWRDVAAHRYFTCGVATDRSLWCWGHNAEGQLGVGDTNRRGVPTRVGTDADWDTVSTGGDQTCALKLDGTAYCWGLNSNGEIGDSTNAQRLTPVPVMTPTRFVRLALGKDHSCGLDASGGVWCWGLGGDGEQGSGLLNDELVPQRIAGTYSSLAAGNFHTCAIAAGDASLYCWGDNSQQTLDPSMAMAYFASPTQNSTGSYVEVTAGDYSTCVRQTDSRVFCFGDNSFGQLGNGNTTSTALYQPVCFPN